MDVIVKNPVVARILALPTYDCGEFMDTIIVREMTRGIDSFHTRTKGPGGRIIVSRKERDIFGLSLRKNDGQRIVYRIGEGITAEKSWTIGLFSG